MLHQSIEKLSRAECDAYLVRLLQGESNLSVKLKQQLSASIATPPAVSQPRRTIEQIFQAEAEAAVRVEQIEQEAATAKRKLDLNDLFSRESEAWEEVDALINKAQGKTYDVAVDLLDKLRDLAADRNQFFSFQKRLDRIYETYGSRKVLIQRLKKIGLDRSN